MHSVNQSPAVVTKNHLQMTHENAGLGRAIREIIHVYVWYQSSAPPA